MSRIKSPDSSLPAPVSLKDLNLPADYKKPDVNFRVFRFINRDNSTDYLALTDQRLDCEGFLAFMTEVSPNKTGDDKWDVIADWEMPDETHAGAERLQAMHKTGLGQNFSEFERHRRIFMQILRSSDRNDVVYEVEHSFRSYADAEKFFVERYTAQGVWDRAEIYYNGDLKWLLTSEKQESFQSKAFDFLRRKHRHFPFFAPSDDKLLEWFLAQPRSFKAQAIQELLNKLSVKDRRRWITQESEMNHSGLFVDNNDVAGYIYIGNNPRTVEQLSNRRFKITHQKTAQIEVEIEGSGGISNLKAIPETFVSTNQISPAFHWQKKSDGSRTLLVGPIDTETKLQAINTHSRSEHNLPEELTYDPNTSNPLVGLLFLASLVPRPQADWPKRLGLPGSHYEQRMGAAQVSILALRDRKLIASNTVDLLVKLEETTLSLSPS